MIDELMKPKFFRKFVHMQHSDTFPTKEFDDFLNEYYDNYHKKEINYKEMLKQKFEQYKTYIEWLTISNTKMLIDHIYTVCKMQLTAQSQLEAESSIFIPLDLTKTESSIEIFANSKAIFKNCHFSDALRTSLIIRDYSTAIFEHCTFEGNKVSAFVMNGSFAKFVDCKFMNDKNISTFVTKDSQCELVNCEFIDIEGKAIFVKDSSNVKIKDTHFINCQKGAATIAEKSKLMLEGGITIKGSKNTALRAIQNSVMNAIGVNIIDTEGNAVNLENSTGYFINCNFNETIHPTIAILGHKSNPIFYKCNLIENMNTFGVICKNGSRPLFDNCNFVNCSTNCFSISDFSKPHIQNCSFKGIDKYFMNVFGGSYLTIYNIKIEDKNVNLDEKINILNSANCDYKSLDEVIQNENSKGLNDDDDDENDEEITCHSWISPKYIIPDKINEMDEPEIIKNGDLKYLKTITLKKIVEQTEKINSLLICSQCHKEMNEDDEPSIMTPCGHLICKDCKGIEKCSLCDCSIKKIQKIFFENECAICLDHKANTISLPCGHMCMCYGCAVQNSLNNFNCPMCNEPLCGYKFVFDDINAKQTSFNQINKKESSTKEMKGNNKKSCVNEDINKIIQLKSINRAKSCVIEPCFIDKKRIRLANSIDIYNCSYFQ